MPAYKKPDTPSVIVKGENLGLEALKLIGDQARNLDAILNRGFRPELNMDCRLVTVTSHVTPGTEFSVAHTLGKVPVGYIVYRRDGAGTVYDGTTESDKTTLYLKSDGSAVEFKLIVF